MNINLEITPAEWQVMRVVWSLRQTTSSQIIEILQKKLTGNQQRLRLYFDAWLIKKPYLPLVKDVDLSMSPSFLNNKRWIKQRTTYLIIFVNDMSEAHLNM